MPAPKEILDLVQRFENNKEDLKSSKYNETQLRREFLDPFFKALGWDMTNEQGYAEAYKDVIHEDAIKIGSSSRAPDYCFRIGGTRKFFVEAKKPFVNIATDIAPAFQLRRYAWSANMPLGILTDFEELAVYDARIKPKKNDSAKTARVMLFKYDQYVEKWDEIAAIFSREAVLKGSFDKYAQKKKGGTEPVDAAFLEEIETWRMLLAKEIAKENEKLTQPQINTAVQKIIDRIIFLRICEDRGIEPLGHLQQIVNGHNAYRRLCDLFRKAEIRYDSGLFHFSSEKDIKESPDDVSLQLDVKDVVIQKIIKNLYPPESPYAFVVLPPEILGRVYEQFLGKVIELTASHQAKIVEKPEVRKAGGVYYTPAYIVDYIVKNTIGKLVEGKTPNQVSKITVVDPACGSGSFLIGAYQFLLDWHRDWYVNNGAVKWSKGKKQTIYDSGVLGWQLTLGERKRILTNNIYGVDLDAQAVEVTKLSLLLKVLEGETQAQLITKRILPDLSANIKCGNSLIRWDYFSEQLTPDRKEINKTNPFEWKTEFVEVFKAGGFDVVIGNPPYLFITELAEKEKQYFFETYSSSEYRFDIYGLFIESSLKTWLKNKGYLSFIIPHTLLSNDSFKKLRDLVINNSHIQEIVDIGPGVFAGAKNETMIFTIRRGAIDDVHAATHVVQTTVENFPAPSKEFTINQKIWSQNAGSAWLVSTSDREQEILNKLGLNRSLLGALCTINQGLRTGDNQRFLDKSGKGLKYKRAAGGKHIARYYPIQKEIYVLYDRELLDAPRKEEIFSSPEKLVVQEIRNITLPRRIVATYDNEQYYCLQSTNVINLRKTVANDANIYFILGVLNSSVVNWYFRQRFTGNNHIASNQLAQIPIPDCKFQAPLVALVRKMLELNFLHSKSEEGAERVTIQRQISATDKQIDELVYKLYDLTDEEMRCIEGRTK